MNEGIKICTVDFLSFDVNETKWKRIKQKQQISTIPGRKNHAISSCAGFFHVCSGVDANMAILADYMIYDQYSKQWTTLT